MGREIFVLLILCLKWGRFYTETRRNQDLRGVRDPVLSGFLSPNGRNQKILVQERCAEVSWAGLQGLQVPLQKREKQGLKQ